MGVRGGGGGGNSSVIAQKGLYVCFQLWVGQLLNMIFLIKKGKMSWEIVRCTCVGCNWGDIPFHVKKQQQNKSFQNAIPSNATFVLYTCATALASPPSTLRT